MSASSFASVREDGLDPVTFEVLRHRLWSINDEHGQTVLKVSGSPHAVYAQDFNPGILTADGEWVYFGPYVQFINAGASSAIKWVLEHRASSPGIAPGDAFVTNDPWIGTVHQQDVVILEPVFIDGALFCWVTNTLHMYDMGGTAPGSYCPTARDVFDEAPIFPPMKIRENGELRVDVQEVIMRQSRLPHLVALDLNALMAGCHVASKRIEEICQRYSSATVGAAMNKIISDAENIFVKRLNALDEGVWRERSFIEVASPDDRSVYTNVLTIRKEGTELYFSNEGSSPAVGSINQTSVAWQGAITAALIPSFLSDQLYAIGGALRHCHFEPIEGLMNCAAHPYAVSNSSPCLSLNTVAVTYNCLSRMLIGSRDPDRKIMAAGANSTMAVNIVSGVNQWGDRVGRTTMDVFLGGIGAQDHRDGVDTGGHAWGPKAMAPNIEHNEHHFPVLYLWRREAADSGGAGRFRGGNSGSVCFVLHRADELTHDVTAWGMAVPTSAGLFGAEPGAPNRIRLVRETEALDLIRDGHLPRSLEELAGTNQFLPQRAERVTQGASDAWVFEWCGGGGFGDPSERAQPDVQQDLRDGHVTYDNAARSHRFSGRDARGQSYDRSPVKQRHPAIQDARDAGNGFPGQRDGTIQRAKRARPLREAHVSDVSAVRHPSLTELVTREVAQRVVTGEFEPGQKISEARIAEVVGVSRGPVREAFHQLAREGLLIIQPRKGTIVAPIMGQEVLDFYDCRMLLEVPCVGLTVPLSDDALVSKLHAVVAEMSVCAAQDRLHDYLLEVARFYELIHERCPNSVLVGVIQSMWRRAMRFRAVAIRAPGRLDDSIAQHSELLEALSVRDRERATTITSAILTGSREAILSELMSRDGRVQSNSPAPIVVKRAPELTERA